MIELVSDADVQRIINRALALEQQTYWDFFHSIAPIIDRLSDTRLEAIVQLHIDHQQSTPWHEPYIRLIHVAFNYANSPEYRANSSQMLRIARIFHDRIERGLVDVVHQWVTE